MLLKNFIITAFILCGLFTHLGVASANNEEKVYRTVGVIEKINAEKGVVTINHEKIEGFMPAMTMDFNVRRKSMLNGLQVGDKVDFDIEDRTLSIVRISKISNR